MRKFFLALGVALVSVIGFSSSAEASYYGIPQNNSGVKSRVVSHKGKTETIVVKFKDGGTRKFVTTQSCKRGKCSLVETITDVTRTGRRTTGKATCTWLSRDRENTTVCKFA